MGEKNLRKYKPLYNVYKTANLIAGIGLIGGIEYEILHKIPHIEIPDYLDRNEAVIFTVSGFVETVIIKGIILPNILNPNFSNSFTVLSDWCPISIIG